MVNRIVEYFIRTAISRYKITNKSLRERNIQLESDLAILQQSEEKRSREFLTVTAKNSSLQHRIQELESEKAILELEREHLTALNMRNIERIRQEAVAAKGDTSPQGALQESSDY